MQKQITIDRSLPAELEDFIEHQLTLGLKAAITDIEELDLRLFPEKATLTCSIDATISEVKISFSVVGLKAEICVSDALARLRREALRIRQRSSVQRLRRTG